MNLRFHPLQTTEVLNSQSALIDTASIGLCKYNFFPGIREFGFSLSYLCRKVDNSKKKKKKQLHQQKAHPAFVKTWTTASPELLV